MGDLFLDQRAFENEEVWIWGGVAFMVGFILVTNLAIMAALTWLPCEAFDFLACRPSHDICLLCTEHKYSWCCTDPAGSALSHAAPDQPGDAFAAVEDETSRAYAYYFCACHNPICSVPETAAPDRPSGATVAGDEPSTADDADGKASHSSLFVTPGSALASKVFKTQKRIGFCSHQQQDKLVVHQNLSVFLSDRMRNTSTSCFSYRKAGGGQHRRCQRRHGGGI